MNTKVISQVMRQRNNKTLTYDGVRYSGSWITTACLLKLKNELLDYIPDRMFDPYTIVLQSSLELGQRIATLREFQSQAMQDEDFNYTEFDELMLHDYYLDEFVVLKKGEDNKWHVLKSLDINDIKTICKFIRSTWVIA